MTFSADAYLRREDRHGILETQTAAWAWSAAGEGAFIGGVHRMAAALDGQIELVAGCFSRDPENTRQTGRNCISIRRAAMTTTNKWPRRGGVAGGPADRFRQHRHAQSLRTFAIAKTFLDAGFHVVCDKPMTFNLDEAEQLVQLVEQSRLVFGLTHNYTGHPLVRHARHLFQPGRWARSARSSSSTCRTF